MVSFGRIVMFYWLIYALDFVTSAYFMSLGYWPNETNSFQRMLVLSPGLGSLSVWMLNQTVWISLGVFGVILATVKTPIPKPHAASLLVLFSLFRLYGVATNVAFTMQATVGIQLPLLAYYTLLCAPVVLASRHELRDYLQVVAKSVGAITNKMTTSHLNGS